MTDMVPTRPPSARSRDSAIGQYKHKRSVTDFGLGLLAPVLGGKFLDRYHLRGPFNRGLKFGVTRVFAAAGATTRESASRRPDWNPALPTTSTSPPTTTRR